VELHHQFTVPASIEETWAAFNDMERVAPCFPGVTLESVTTDGCEGTVKVKLGPISQQYKGTATFVERSESDRRIGIKAGGKDKRGQGTADATITISLADDGGSTRVDVDTDLAITGKPAQFGRGMIQDVSDKYLEQFVATLSQRLASNAEAPAEASAPATGGTPAGSGAPVGDAPAPPSVQRAAAPLPAAPAAPEINVVAVIARRYRLQLGALGLLIVLLIVWAVRG
jgi:carbon monoxide dehydrogenase subunit G